MPFDLPFDLQTVLNYGRGLIYAPGFWWQVTVLVLAAGGALLVHRVMNQSLSVPAAAGEDYTVRHFALKALQRILFPISMLLGVLAGRALLLHLG
ncbi:MAG: hypothetical protein Q8L92_16755, partial [Rubrivivax sp.]|nr:hypothetical protein [Rubrivivax sp.]